MLCQGDEDAHGRPHHGDVEEELGLGYVHNQPGEDGRHDLRRHAHRIGVARVAANAPGAAALKDHGIHAQVNGAKGSTHEQEEHVVEGRERREEPHDGRADGHHQAGHEDNTLPAHLKREVGDGHVGEKPARNGNNVDDGIGAAKHREEVRCVARDVGGHGVIGHVVEEDRAKEQGNRAHKLWVGHAFLALHGIVVCVDRVFLDAHGKAFLVHLGH